MRVPCPKGWNRLEFHGNFPEPTNAMLWLSGLTLIDPQFLAIAMIQRLWGQSFLRSLAATIVAVGHAEEGSAPGRGGKPIPIQAIPEMRRRIKKSHPFGQSLMRFVGNEERKRLGGDQIFSGDAVNRRNTVAKIRLSAP